VTVKLDGAGQISGVLTDKATGAPVASVCPSVVPVSKPFYGEPPVPESCTRSDGRYTIRNLGPYRWKVEFPDFNYGAHAWQWSGGAPTRATATPVPVTVGGTATADAALVKGGTISGSITRPNGPLDWVAAGAVSTTTNDWVGARWNDGQTARYTIAGLTDGDVYVWFAPAGDWTDRYPTVVHATAGHAVTGIDITLPD
jgi:hypothetical protein